MPTEKRTSPLPSEDESPGIQERVVIHGKEMDPSLWSQDSSVTRLDSDESEENYPSSSTPAPPAKRPRVSSPPVDLKATTANSASKKKSPRRKSVPRKKAASRNKTTTKNSSRKKAKNAASPKKCAASTKKGKISLPPMRWTVSLTALAFETRYKNKRILKKFAVTTADTKLMRAKWEATVHTFLEQALIENAWGEGETPREVTVEQFKNKLNAVRTAYRARRTRLLATGNEALGTTPGSDVEEEERRYTEMPRNFFLHPPEDDEEIIRDNLTCDPMDVDPKYRAVLGKELTALWPLLCEIFSGKPGCTGEPIVESGAPRDYSDNEDGVDEDDERGDEYGAGSDDECSDSSSQARNEAKANAKARSQSGRLSLNRPVDVIAESLQAGFGSIERILTVRQTPASSTRSSEDMNQLVAKLATTIEAANASQAALMEMQRDASQSLRQSVENLQQMSASVVEIFAKMKEQICGINL